MIDWRQWLWDSMQDPSIKDLLDGGIHAAGSLKGAPDKKPFAVLRLGFATSVLNDTDEPLVINQEAIVYLHDNPGSYTVIDSILVLVRSKLVGQVTAESAIACTWQGDSGELSDEFYRTITRNGSYRLTGRT